jgi:hypothetical protein
MNRQGLSFVRSSTPVSGSRTPREPGTLACLPSSLIPPANQPSRSLRCLSHDRIRRKVETPLPRHGETERSLCGHICIYFTLSDRESDPPAVPSQAMLSSWSFRCEWVRKPPVPVSRKCGTDHRTGRNDYSTIGTGIGTTSLNFC